MNNSPDLVAAAEKDVKIRKKISLNESKWRFGLKSCLQMVKISLIRQNCSLDFALFAALKTIDVLQQRNDLFTAIDKLHEKGVFDGKNPKALKKFKRDTDEMKKKITETDKVYGRISLLADDLLRYRSMTATIDGDTSNIIDLDSEMARLATLVGNMAVTFRHRMEAESSSR